MELQIFKVSLKFYHIVLLLPCLVTGQITFGQSLTEGNPFYENFSIKDYYAGPSNRSITQNDQGLLFFGNNFGLIKYDGTQWEVLPLSVKEGVAANSVFYADERIYAGSQREFGYFESNEIGQLEYKSLSARLDEEGKNSFREVWKIWKINKSIVFYSYERIFVYVNDELTSFPLDKFKPLAAALNNKIYLVGINSTLYSFNGSKFEKEIEDPLFKEVWINSILPNGKNNLLLFTENEILEYDLLSVNTFLSTDQYPLKDAKIVTAIKDQSGNFIIGTKNKGLIIIDGNGNLKKTIDNTNGLKSQSVYCIFRDKFNSLWIGHNNGISRIDYKLPFSTYGENLGVIGAGFTAAAKEDNIFLGTNNGLFVQKKDSKSRFRMIPNTNGAVHDLYQYNERLLMGHSKGVYEISNNQTAKLIAETDGCWNFLINKRFPDNLYIGSYHGLYILKTGSNQSKKIDGFEEACRIMEFDKEGFLWVTHGLKGIFRIELSNNGEEIKQVKFYGAGKVLPSSYHNNVFKIDQELVFTGNTGIYRFDHSKQEFYRYHKFDEVLKQEFHIRELEEDELGNIYYWSREEAGMLKKKNNGKYEKIHKPFNKIINLVDDGIVEFNAIDKNNIFLGANEGFIKYSPEPGGFKQDPFATIIREVEIFSPKDSVIFKNYAGHKLQNKSIIPYSNNSLRFKYSAVFFTDREGIRYKYLIEGFDTQWSSWGNKSEKEYINLPEGDYTFNVMAVNVYGVESNISSFSFTILPPWYRSKIAFLIYLLLIAGSLYMAFKILQKKHTKEKRIIEEFSEKEINKRETALVNVSKKSEEEIMKLKNEKLRAEINHKNKELATSTLHLLNKNKLLSEIKSRLVATTKAKEIDKYQKDVKSILGEIDKNIEHDTDWEQFEFHFDLVHGDFSSRIRQAYPTLSPQDMKIAAYLRMNLSTKEIAQLLNISLRGVEKARYRLRKKLELERQINLTEYILNF